MSGDANLRNLLYTKLRNSHGYRCTKSI